MERSGIGRGAASKMGWIKRGVIKIVKRIIMREAVNNKEGGAEEGIEIWKKRIRSV